MCVIVDTCTFSSVFDPTTKRHLQYAPVRDWIERGHGKLIFGGTKFTNELGRSRRLAVLVELEKKRKLVIVPDNEVDKIGQDLKKKAPEPAFDDEHLIALVIVSKCCVVCTDDKRAFPYLKNKDLYPKGFKRPKIYRSKRNKDLCCEKHMADICR